MVVHQFSFYQFIAFPPNVSFYTATLINTTRQAHFENENNRMKMWRNTKTNQNEKYKKKKEKKN